MALGPQPGALGIPGQGMYRPNPPRASVQQPNMPRQPNANLPQAAAARMPMATMMRMPNTHQQAFAHMQAAAAAQVIDP